MSYLLALWRDYCALPEVQFMLAHWQALLILILGSALLVTIFAAPSQWRPRLEKGPARRRKR